MAQLIDGKGVARQVLDEVKAGVAALAATRKIVPGLAVVLVGEDPASQAYVAAKSRTAKECGFLSVQHSLPADTSEDTLLSLIETLNKDDQVHGILVQLPLPAPLRSGPVIQAIDPSKDVDGLHVVNAGKLASGDRETGLLPCTPAGAMRLVETIHGRDLSGKSAVVIGRSNLFGKPMAQLLLAADATVTMAHSLTADLPSVARRADILVVAVGRPLMVTSDWIKPGATMIDVGINRIAAKEKGEGGTRLVGDVDYDGALPVAGALTPVPGGVGPMTIAMLMANTLKAACRSGKD